MAPAPITLDPAHGGSDPQGKSTPFGRTLPGGLEKDATLDLARRVQAHLAYGTRLTRDGDFNLSLSRRQQVSRSEEGGVFVSVHASGAGPAQVFVHPRAGSGSHRLGGTVAGALGGLLRQDAELAVLHPEGLHPSTDACLVDVGAGAEDGDDLSHRLAWAIQAHLDRGAGSRDRFGSGDLVPAPRYNPSSAADSARAVQAWESDLHEWIQGVSPRATALFPHSAICKLEIHTNLGVFAGTGFYIARDRIMTAGHCVTGVLPDGRRYTATRIVARPGVGADMSIPPADIARPADFAVHPNWLGGASPMAPSWDLAVLQTTTQPLGDAWFPVEQLTFSPQGGITVCGYPGRQGTESNNLQMSIPHDPNKQHMSRNQVIELFPNGEGFFTGTQAIGGVSGSPIFISDGQQIKAVAIMSAYHRVRRQYAVCALTPDKIRWALGTPFPATQPWPPRFGGRPLVRPSRLAFGDGQTWDWSHATDDQRILHVMESLVDTHGYPVNGAAGLVGNLWAESGIIPNRLEGSHAGTPMRARDFNGNLVDFTPDQIMARSSSAQTGPRLPGIGLAQWTSSNRRSGLFTFTWEGITLGSEILFNMDAQIAYLVQELAGRYRAVDTVLRGAAVTVDDAADEVVYHFEVPGAVLDGGHLRPRTDPQVQTVFSHRRAPAQRALRVYQAAHP